MQKNVGTIERAASVALGSLALWTAWRGLSRGVWPVGKSAGVLSAATAGGMLWRGATGNCPLYQQLGVDTRDLADRRNRRLRMVRSVVINKPIEDVQQALTGSSLRGGEFRASDGGRAFVRDAEGQHWRLKLKSLSGNTKTRLVASIKEDEHASLFRRVATGVRLGTLRNLASDELRNLKALAEAGEVATVAGQPHGDRSMVGKALLGEADRNAVAEDEYIPSQLQDPELRSLEAST